MSRYQSHIKGSGPIAIEIWLDYICPFSKKQFLKLYDEVIPAVDKEYPDRFQWVFRHQVQPWHGQGVWLHETAVAVGLIEPKLFWDFSKKLFEVSSDYYDCNSTTKSRNEIVAQLAQLADEFGIPKGKVADATAISGQSGETKITPDIKYYVKLGRQNGVHVSPSILINGIFANDISSSWGKDEWLAKLKETDRLTETKI